MPPKARQGKAKQSKAGRNIGRMDVQKINIRHMVGGDGETSYAMNSTVQKNLLNMTKPYLQKAILDLYCDNNANFPKCLRIADLGCSSGPNALVPTSQMLDAIHTMCHKSGLPSPEFQVFLNDLPGSDFNSVFNSIPVFYEKLKNDNGHDFGPCFITGVPGSFYGRLFPSQTLCVVHSSASLQFLSQVPQGIESNKGNVYLAPTSPPEVFKAYLNQFQKDFSLFLSTRSEEILPGGRMVLTLVGRTSSECYSKERYHFYGLLTDSLRDMVSEQLVDQAKLDSFNVPFYNPNDTELKDIIEGEGSFKLDLLETIDLDWDVNDESERNGLVFDKIASGRNVAKFARAIIDSIIVAHFGEEIVDELFRRFAERVGDHLAKEKTKHVLQLICLTRK